MLPCDSPLWACAQKSHCSDLPGLNAIGTGQRWSARPFLIPQHDGAPLRHIHAFAPGCPASKQSSPCAGASADAKPCMVLHNLVYIVCDIYATLRLLRASKLAINHRCIRTQQHLRSRLYSQHALSILVCVLVEWDMDCLASLSSRMCTCVGHGVGALPLTMDIRVEDKLLFLMKWVSPLRACAGRQVQWAQWLSKDVIVMH